MTSLRRVFAPRAVLALGIGLLPGIVVAEGAGIPSDLALALASCSARYGALVEDSWLHGGEDDAARLRRDWISAALEASLTDAPDRERIARTLLSRRISEKAQTKALLRTARFAQDTRRQSMAQAMLRRHLAACDELVLGRRTAGF